MIKPFRKIKSYFIHSDGYIFQVLNGKEIFPKVELTKTKKPFIRIGTQTFLLIDEMEQHFIKEFPENGKLSFVVTKDLRVPLASMKVVKVQNEGLSKEESYIAKTYKCYVKASYANKRCLEQITGLQVYLCLKYNDFKCAFCADKLLYNLWHLDHYQPISRGGKNIFENLEPSCDKCNIMKGALSIESFYKQCEKITKNFIYKADIKGQRDKAQKIDYTKNIVNPIFK